MVIVLLTLHAISTLTLSCHTLAHHPFHFTSPFPIPKLIHSSVSPFILLSLRWQIPSNTVRWPLHPYSSKSLIKWMDSFSFWSCYCFLQCSPAFYNVLLLFTMLSCFSSIHFSIFGFSHISFSVFRFHIPIFLFLGSFFLILEVLLSMVSLIFFFCYPVDKSETSWQGCKTKESPLSSVHHSAHSPE